MDSSLNKTKLNTPDLVGDSAQVEASTIIAHGVISAAHLIKDSKLEIEPLNNKTMKHLASGIQKQERQEYWTTIAPVIVVAIIVFLLLANL